MSGDTEIDDLEVSDGASENEYSDHEQDLGKEEDDNTDMAEQKFGSETVDENGKVVGSTVTKPKLDPKDPLRPRRKKARRACFACQRAHLTCGMFLVSLSYDFNHQWVCHIYYHDTHRLIHMTHSGCASS
jgi:hypothetical protein